MKDKEAVKKEISDEEMIKTIADFIEMGHVENIVIMFKKDQSYYKYISRLIQDERFVVRMGIVLLFEELAAIKPIEVTQAIPFLTPLLKEEIPLYVKGEVLTILGIIGGGEARQYIEKYVDDPDPQLAEIAKDYLRN